MLQSVKALGSVPSIVQTKWKMFSHYWVSTNLACQLDCIERETPWNLIKHITSGDLCENASRKKGMWVNELRGLATLICGWSHPTVQNQKRGRHWHIGASAPSCTRGSEDCQALSLGLGLCHCFLLLRGFQLLCLSSSILVSSVLSPYHNCCGTTHLLIK